MKYTDQHNNIISLAPSDGWQYATGYWTDSRGEVLNLPERIAEHGGALKLDSTKEKTVTLLALTYAKRRRERSLLALQQEIANLEGAINQLEN